MLVVKYNTKALLGNGFARMQAKQFSFASEKKMKRSQREVKRLVFEKEKAMHCPFSKK